MSAPTIEIGHFASLSAVFDGQHFLRHMFVERFQRTVQMDALPDFLFEKRLHEIGDGVDQRRHIDDVHLLQLDRIGFLFAIYKDRIMKYK